MKSRSSRSGSIRIFQVATLCLMSAAGPLLTSRSASAQTVQDRVNAITIHLKQLNDFASRLPAPAKDKLSSGAQRLLRMAARWHELQPLLTSKSAELSSPLSGTPFQPAGTLPPGEVSDPSTDLNFSRMAGFTQSETSTAWCGHNVVLAYNDSGSFFETFPVNIGVSFNGYSRSTDRGRTYTDLGYLNPGPNLANVLGGDPVVACSDESTFYYSSIFSSSLFDTGASVSKSTDGGQSFGDPVEVVSKSLLTNHFIDKPWMTVDPSNPRKIYVTYTDVDMSHTVCPVVGLGIELVSSTDAGATWSAPTIIDNSCYPNYDQGPNVAVDTTGKVYVAWEKYRAFLPTNEIDIASSTNGGASFSAPTPVSIVTPVGSFGLLQGGFRNNEFPSLAIDRSHGNALYIAWNDGRFDSIPDGFPPGISGVTYNFGDILVSRSGDGGATWSAPTKADDNTDSDSAHADHFLPAIAVDRQGVVGVCFYDRRHDARNFRIDRECAFSHDGAQTWGENQRITDHSFSPSIADDFSLGFSSATANPAYMGDYDTLVADSTGRSHRFRGAFADNSLGNPDVRTFANSDEGGNNGDNGRFQLGENH